MKIFEITKVSESLDNPYPFNLQGPDSSHNFAATAQTPNGVLRMDFEAIDYDDFGIDFAVGKSMGKTEAGDEFRVFATVVAMMNKWIKTVGIESVESFDFGANKGEHASDGRAKLYARFAKKLADQLGWKLEQSTTANRSTEFFKLTNPKPVPRDDDHWDDLEDNPGLEESLNLAEAIGEIASATEIYVDMDGVLADFFGEWAKLMQVDHFTDIDKQHDINDALQKIRDTDDFWLRLPILPEAKNLLNLIKQVKGEYSICTSPLADDPNSEKHKRIWVEKNLAFFPPKEVFVTHNKPQFATAKDGTPNILIDDYGVNINAWEAAGGIGFKYKDHKFERTAKDIKQHIDAPVEENFADGKKKVQEAFDNPYPIKWLSLRPGSSSSAKAKLDDGSELEIHFADDDAGYYDIEFLRSGSMKVSGEGDEFRVFATVQAAILEWWKQADKKYVRAISFSADKGDNNRSKLYKRFAEMWAKKIKWQFKIDDGRRDVEFSLIRPKAVEENFADGKKAGKK